MATINWHVNCMLDEIQLLNRMKMSFWLGLHPSLRIASVNLNPTLGHGVFIRLGS